MANRGFFSGYKVGRERVDLEFSFTAPGAGASVTAIDDDGKGVATITHTGGTAVLGVTLKDAYNKVLSAEASVHATDGKRATIDTFANEGSATGAAVTFNIRTWTAAGAANNDNADRITCRLTLRNTRG